MSYHNNLRAFLYFGKSALLVEIYSFINQGGGLYEQGIVKGKKEKYS